MRVEPDGERGIYHTDELRSENRMIEPATGETKAGGDISQLEVGEFVDDLLRREPIRQEIQHIDHANPHPADARPSAALLRIDSNSIHELDGLTHCASRRRAELQ